MFPPKRPNPFAAQSPVPGPPGPGAVVPPQAAAGPGTAPVIGAGPVAPRPPMMAPGHAPGPAGARLQMILNSLHKK
jgi:hypothetical protein